MTTDQPNLEQQLARLSPEAQARVRSALQEALAKETGLQAAGFDKLSYDRSKATLEDLISPPQTRARGGG